MKTPARLSKLAACSLIFGIFSFVLFILIPAAIVIGLAALYNIRRSSGSLKGTPLAVSGITASFITLIFAGLVIINDQVHYRSFKVPTASMSPTIESKERIAVDLAAYKTKNPARGDIIVYELPDNGKRRLMCKRVVGLPGEEVEIRDGKAFINGAPMKIPGLSENAVYLNGGNFGKAGQAVKIQDGFYYVLGDNPSMSFDSRQHGAIGIRDIEGKSVFAYKGLPVKQIIDLLLKKTVS